MAISKDDLLQLSGLKVEEREIPAVGLVRIRELSAAQRMELGALGDPQQQGAYFLVCCLVGDDDKALFGSVQEAKSWLGSVNGDVSDPIFSAIWEVNGVDLDAVRENFTPARNGSSPTV